MLGDPSVDGPVQGAVQLADRILRSDSGRNCITQQLHRFAQGRLETSDDTCAFVSLAQKFEASGDKRARPPAGARDSGYVSLPVGQLSYPGGVA